jgi:hypothetical protein
MYAQGKSGPVLQDFTIDLCKWSLSGWKIPTQSLLSAETHVGLCEMPVIITQF